MMPARSTRNIPAASRYRQRQRRRHCARRHRARDAEPSRRRSRSQAWQQAARALVVRELLLQRARALGIAAEPLSDEDGPPRDRGEATHARRGRARGGRAGAGRRGLPALLRAQSARFRSADIYEAAHILFAALPADKEAYAQARADAGRACDACKENPELFADAGAGLFALPVGGAGRQSRSDHARTDHARVRAGDARA